MQGYYLKKEDLNKFIQFLKRKFDVIGPVKRDLYRYEILNDELPVYNHTTYSAKKFFLPPVETLYIYEKNKINAKIKVKPRVMFIHRCDANALLIIDNLYLKDHKDPYYKKRRKNTILIDWPCIPDKNCFCKSMDLVDYFDLRFIDNGKRYFVEYHSKKGKSLINNLFKPTKDKGKYKQPKCKKKIHTSKGTCSIYVKGNTKKLWEKYADMCLSCSACTVVCPTCSCFDIKDIYDFDLKIGKRQRAWSSCQVWDYTRVAGGYIFRKDREKRVKQRILCKLSYMYDIFGRARCVGCGRCISSCPTDIDIVEIANKLECKR